MTPSILDQLRTAIADDERSPNKIALMAGVSPPAMYRFVDGKTGLAFETARRIGEVVGLRIAIVCEPLDSIIEP